MSRVVEIVLAIEPKSAGDWARERAAGPAEERHAKRGPARVGIGPAIADALNRTARVAVLSPRERVVLRAVDRDGMLAASGWSVMVEESSGVRRVTASHGRELVPGVRIRDAVCDEPLDAGTPLTLCEGLPHGLKTAMGHAGELAPSGVLECHRTVWRWTALNGGTVDITLNDTHDRAPLGASLHPLAPPPPATPAAPSALPPACELRLSSPCAGERENACESAVRALFAAAAELVEMLPVFPSLTDAWRRACDGARPEVPARAADIELGGAKTPHVALIAVGSNIARHWFGNEHGVRESSTTEFVHQMRVAHRRMKTLAKVFPDWVDEAWRTRVEPELAWLGGMLGEARDLDVFTDSTLPALAAADADPSSWSNALAAADARRLEARARLQEAMGSRRYARLSLAWLDWLASLPYASAPPAVAGLTLREYAVKHVRKHHKRLTAAPALTSLDAAARHRRRIEAKRLRYTLEFFEPIAAGKTRREVVKTLARLQGVLGDGSDAAAALRFLEQLDVTPYQRGFARGWCEAVSRYTAQEGDRLLRSLGKPKLKRNA